MASETREQLRERLKWEKRLGAFESRLTELKFECETEAEAWALCAKEFPPRTDIVPSPGARQREWQAEVKEKHEELKKEKHEAAASTILKKKFGQKLGVPPRKVIEFVFEHMDTADVKPEDAPSAGAWSMLQEVRNNPVFRHEFYKTIYPRLLPTKAQIDAEHSSNKDDGRAIFGALEAVRRASAQARSALPSGPEGAGTES